MGGLELRHLRLFLAAAEEGSISRAAARLRIAQPAVSRALAELERHVGHTLLARDPRGVHPTEAGKLFQAKAASAVAAVDDALSGSIEHVRPLRVSYTWSAASQYTTELLRSWRHNHPQIELTLQRVDHPDGGLTRGLADIAILRGHTYPRQLRTERVYTENRVAAVPNYQAFAGRDELRLDELTDCRLVLNSASGTTSLDLWRGTQLSAVMKFSPVAAR